MKPFTILLVLMFLASCRGGNGMTDIDYSEDFISPKEIELVKSIRVGNVIGVRKLAEQGVNLNAVGERENTPLRVAVKLKRKQMVRLLFQLGVDPNARTPKGTVAAADDAVIEKDPAYLQTFLEFGLDPNLKSEDVPLIFFAVSEENWHQYDMLLAHGADINSKLPDGSSLMLDLVLQMEYDRAKDLLLKGADYRGKSMHGLNVLDLLVDYQRRMCIDPDLPDCHKRAELLRLLHERGATLPPGLPYM
jgi:uncharacterized protein